MVVLMAIVGSGGVKVDENNITFKGIGADLPTMEDTYNQLKPCFITLGRSNRKAATLKHFFNIMLALSMQVKKAVKVETHIERTWTGKFSKGKVEMNETLCKDYHCPTCGYLVGNEYFNHQPKHCKECGQALRYIK
jgi:rubrerythrin